MRAVLSIFVAVLLLCCAVSDCHSQSVIFMDDFDGNTVPAFEVMPVAGEMIPEDDMPWGVNASGGLDATWETENNPFPDSEFYALLSDPQTSDDGGIRFLTTDDGGDPNDFGSQIMGQVTTFVFDFYEPPDPEGDDAGFGFGYSNADDLNASERVWRAFLNNGQLIADNGVGTADPIAYPEETVHRIFMVANDSASPVNNYREEQTLEPSEADVWISVDGEEPVYAFSLGMQNAGPHGAGFRSFTGDLNELWVDNVFILEGADFSFTPEPPDRLSLLVDPENGQVRIENNTDVDLMLNSYQITSEEVSLNESGWNPISDQNISGFPVGDGSGNGWEVGPNANDGELVEWFLQGESTLEAGEGISLGQAYNTVVDVRNLAFRYTDELDRIQRAAVEYGPIEPPMGVEGDYNNDGVVNAADYVLWRNGGPLMNDPTPGVQAADYDFWVSRFGATSASGKGSGANPVPEPQSAVIVLLAACGAIAGTRRSLRGASVGSRRSQYTH